MPDLAALQTSPALPTFAAVAVEGPHGARPLQIALCLALEGLTKEPHWETVEHLAPILDPLVRLVALLQVEDEETGDGPSVEWSALAAVGALLPLLPHVTPDGARFFRLAVAVSLEEAKPTSRGCDDCAATHSPTKPLYLLRAADGLAAGIRCLPCWELELETIESAAAAVHAANGGT